VTRIQLQATVQRVDCRFLPFEALEETPVAKVKNPHETVALIVDSRLCKDAPDIRFDDCIRSCRLEGRAADVDDADQFGH
jgi:hypothetical protein